MNRLILQISQALLRVCQNIRQKDIKSRLEANSVYLSEIAANSDIIGIQKSLAVIEQLVFLGEGFGEIEYYQGQVLHKQFEILRRLILEDKERKRLESAIEDIFSGDYQKYSQNISGHEPSVENEANSPSPSQISKRETSEDKQMLSNKTWDGKNPAINEAGVIDGLELPKTIAATLSDFKDNQAIQHGTNRQDLIAEKIGLLGKAAMKDIIASFPSVSERTLRYDLQKLTDRQILERVGSGGPASYYTIKRSFIARDLL